MGREFLWSFEHCVRSWAYIGLLCLAGCGYQFAGQSDLFPKDVHSIYVEPFLNRTRDIGAGNEITSALRSEFYRRGQLQLVDQPDRADAILSGVVRNFDSLTASVNGNDEVLQYDATLIVDATFRRREPSEILWRGQVYATQRDLCRFASRGGDHLIKVSEPNPEYLGRAATDRHTTDGNRKPPYAGRSDRTIRPGTPPEINGDVLIEREPQCPRRISR